MLDPLKQRIAEAWMKAADCSMLAEEATSKEARAMYEKLRDSWIQVANNLELIDGIEKKKGVARGRPVGGRRLQNM